ncbi:MAG: hypothetical protein RBT57_11690 [Paludibacter sp.]|jgi:hypothetical protein|nr:hypothetical protein [Paludibacter sp.]
MKVQLTVYLLVIALSAQAGFRERIELLTDKNSYLSGEDIVVTATTTNAGRQAVEFSKVAYVELTDTNRVQAQLMMVVENATGRGILSIPGNLPTGYYRLRAYTRFMRNEGSEVFANRVIAVVNAATLHHSELGGKAGQLEVSGSEPGNATEHSEVSESDVPERALQSTKQGWSGMVRTDKARYGRREKGLVTVEGMPAGVAVYHLSIAADMGLEEIPAVKDTLTLNKSTINPSSYLAEYEGHIITASIKGISPATRAVLLSVPGTTPSLIAGRKTDSGDYEFITRNLKGTIELVTSIDTREDERFTLDFQSPFAPVNHCKLPELKIDSANIPAIVQRYIALQARDAFQPELYNYQKLVHSSSLTPEWTYRLEEYTRFNTIEEVILEFVSNVRFRRINGIRTLAVNREGVEGYTLGNTLVVLDNVPVFNHELLLNYDASLVKQIDVYRGQYVFSGQLYDGIVSFSTYTSDFRGFQLDRSTMINTYKGPQPRVQLKTPDTFSGQLSHNEPDFRTTLLMESHRSPEKLQLPFITSDHTGTYFVRIKGLTTDGNEFSETRLIEVN